MNCISAVRRTRALSVGLLLSVGLVLSGCASKSTNNSAPVQPPPPAALTPLPGANEGSSANIEDRTPDTDARKRARLRMELGITYYQDAKYSVALDELKQSMQLDPTFADPLGVLALVYMELGEKQLAEQSFQRALQLQPNGSDINTNYGWFLCGNGKEAQSIPYFLNAIRNPLYAHPALALQDAGVCEYRIHAYAEAENYFLRSFQLDPSSGLTAYGLALIYFDQKQIDKAHFYIGRVNSSGNAAANTLWLGIRVEHMLGNNSEEASLGTQLVRGFPASVEAQLYQRRAYNE